MSLQLGLLSLLFFSQGDSPPQVDVNIQVVYRDIRVHVTDKNGEPVIGLKPEDFIVKENRKTQDVSFFEEVDLGDEVMDTLSMDEPASEAGEPGSEVASKSPQSSRNLMLVLDSSNMRPQAFREMKEAMRDFINDYITPNDLVKLIQLDGELIHLSTFVKSKERLLEGLDEAYYRGTLYNRLVMQEGEVIEQYKNYLAPPGHGAPEAALFNSRVQSDDEAFKSDQGFYLRRVREAVRAKELSKRAAYTLFNNTMEFFGTVFDQMIGAKAVYLFTGGGYVNKMGIEKTTNHQANTLGYSLTTHNVTVYSFVHVAKDPVAVEMRSLSSVRLDDNTNPLSELGSEGRHIQGTVLEEPTQVTTAPLSASQLTGGIMVTANSVGAIRTELERFGSGIQHYYRLGYTIDAPNSKTKVKIQLAKRQKGWKIHYGKQFRPIKPFVKKKLKKQRQDFTVELEYGQANRNNLDAEWGFSAFRGADRGESVPVYVKIPRKTFPKKGYMVGFSAHNDVRDLIDMSTAVINHETEADGYLLYDVLIPRTKPAFVRGLVIDLDTGMKSNFEVDYREPKIKSNEMSVASVMLSQDKGLKMIPINHIRCGAAKDGKKETREVNRCEKDPFFMGGFMVKPSITKTFASNERIELLFQVKNTFSPIDQVEVRLDLRGEGKTTETELDISNAHQLDENTVNYMASFSTENLKPGSYSLALSIIDPGSGDVSLHQHPFQIQN